MRLLLAGILTAGVLIRIPGLLHDGLWRDEAYVYVDAIAPTFQTFLHRVIVTEYHPPLYFAISYAWLGLAGTSELALKAIPFVCSVFTIAAVYRLGAIAGSAGVGLLAAAMYAVSPMAILESGDYLYPLMALLCTVLAALVMTARREPLRPTLFVAIALVTALTTYTHYAALFYVPMLVVWALRSPRGVRHGAAVAGAMVLGALPFLFWLPVLAHQPDPYLVKPALGPVNPLFEPPPNALAKLGFFAWTIVRSMPLWPEKLAIVLCAFLAVALARLIMARRLNADAIALGVIYGAALALISAAGRLNVRYAVIFEGLLCVFLAWIVAAWFQRVTREYPSHWARWGAAVTATISLFIATEDVIFALHTAGMPKSGIRTFAVSQPLDAATLYVIAPDDITATFAFYSRDAHVAYTAFPQTDHPEIFKFGHNANAYAPGAVPDAVNRLVQDARTYEYIDLIVDDTADRRKVSRGVVYRSPTRDFLDAMKAHYLLVGQTSYPGRMESVTVYRLRTGPRLQ
ncbi:MAG TPA: glycosyltransferase family 39 protein [Candidatus Binatia bacterium]|nr:glycosyltransferase family 39 protein [Candidatus Binatia bacterium]